MKIYSVLDEEFRPYGRVVDSFDAAELVDALKKTPVTEGTEYLALDENLQNLPSARRVSDSLFGGMPVQLGWCNGHNRTLNCLEYHRDSEFNLGTMDFILLLAKEDEIEDGKLDTSKVRAFKAPAGKVIEVYADTLHYAPCDADEDGFQVLVALPLGTNGEKPEFAAETDEDRMLFAKNKWLLAHPEAPEAKNGAWIGLTGENITL